MLEIGVLALLYASEKLLQQRYLFVLPVLLGEKAPRDTGNIPTLSNRIRMKERLGDGGRSMLTINNISSNGGYKERPRTAIFSVDDYPLKRFALF